MSEGVVESNNDDIYSTWGINRTRIDLPAYGEEYAAWKKTTPQDVQKIILDCMSARKIGKLTDTEQRQQLAQEYSSKEEYPQLREKALSEATKVSTGIHAFIKENYTDLLPDLVAVGLDGSSLYRPRAKGDIDMWVMLKKITPRALEMSTQYYLQVQRYQFEREEVEFRLAELDDAEKYAEQGQIHPFLTPHKIISAFNLPSEKYQETISKVTDSIRKHKDKIHERTRYLVHLQKNPTQF